MPREVYSAKEWAVLKWLVGMSVGGLGILLGWWWRGIWDDDPADWNVNE
jgi:hypothetical protein